MTADDAFDNLMSKNALPIPVAKQGAKGNPSAAGDRRDDADFDALAEEVMRVESLLGEAPTDYRPAEGDTEVGLEGVYGNPTETDLEPAALEPEEVSSARLHGARVLGRDAKGGHPDDTSMEATADYDETVNAADTGLGLARRVQRFSFLPLSGMEAFENQARELMTVLASKHSDRPSLLLTSAQRRAGRTEMAIRLALAMAKRVGSRILLADFDLGHPAAAARLGVSSKHFALSDVLRGSCPLGEALVVSEEDNLYVLPARAADRDGDEVVDSRQVRGLFGQLHGLFDFIVVDSGPVGNAGAMILANIVGATALVAFCGQTNANEIAVAAERLEAAGARMAGVLLTGA